MSISLCEHLCLGPNVFTTQRFHCIAFFDNFRITFHCLLSCRCSSDEAGQQMALEDTTNNHGPNVPVCPSGGIRNRIRRNSGQSKTIHRQKRSTRITSDSAKTPDSKTVCFPVTSSNGQIRQLSGRQVSARSSIRNIVNERNSEEDDIRLGYKDGSPGGKAQTKVNRLGYRPVDGPPVARPPAGLSDSDAHDTDIEDEGIIIIINNNNIVI